MATVLADTVVVLHLLFVLFVVGGGLLVLRWRWLAWVHVPAAVWGAAIEFVGGVCPLTPLEHRLRVRAGEVSYSGGFVDHYLLPVLYPEGLTLGHQYVLGGLVLLVNAAIYLVVVRRSRPRGAVPARDEGL